MYPHWVYLSPQHGWDKALMMMNMFIEVHKWFVDMSKFDLLSYTEPQQFSKDGHEAHMQVNHLAPALLSILLLPSLIRGSPSRVVNVNSIVSACISTICWCFIIVNLNNCWNFLLDTCEACKTIYLTCTYHQIVADDIPSFWAWPTSNCSSVRIWLFKTDKTTFMQSSPSHFISFWIAAIRWIFL